MTKKTDLIKKAQDLNIDTDKKTIAQLEADIEQASLKTDQADLSRDKLEVLAENIEESKESQTFAKAGKRSQRSVTEAKAEIERQARKLEESETEAKPKKAVKPPRPRSQRRSKKYKKAAELIDANKIYECDEALNLIIKTATTKFDSSVDMVVSLGVDLKKPDQNIRDFVVLPSGTGKKIRIAVYADEDICAKALEKGASVAGKDVFLQQLEKGMIDFDILITMPHLMASLSKYARLLGPKGLMPNPKAGTITKDVLKTIDEAQAGRIEYRVDENGLIHLSIGKVSFGSEKLKANLETVINSLKQNKPASLKGGYIKDIHLSTTMGPSLKMSL